MAIRKLMLTLATAGAVLAGTPAMAAVLEVYKTPWCGCCTAWAEAFRAAGYDVQLTDMEDLTEVRESAGVAEELEGCHTAEIEGYFIEGHVPLEAVAKLLEERPAIRGLAVPGMPSGSLGMGDDPEATYDVIAVNADGPTSVYMSIGNQ
ncbi:DUF411 domain-containing protein [Aliihoeflea sp. 40Bstr573]|uniref:DUF411 domain-containing protein n=1 Tax=Aliihoeflea sp. 40Bstr573 TaxID=2696467 RepID=UPI0020962BA2|nr:DUF411 domain-containing protein [Aliihoeflea sp. 40Bstr573]MCO6389318.1 DUF411 domain-containing protein [Aliihoeflea sp. 40Bstr573]